MCIQIIQSKLWLVSPLIKILTVPSVFSPLRTKNIFALYNFFRSKIIQRLHFLKNKINKFFNLFEVYYKNVTNDFVIRWYSKKRQWLFDWRGLNNDNVCAAAGTQNVSYPSLMTRIWNVYDGKLKKWVKDETIQVKVIFFCLNNFPTSALSQNSLLFFRPFQLHVCYYFLF